MKDWKNRVWLASFDIPENLAAFGWRLMDKERELLAKFAVGDLNEALADAFAANLQASYAIEDESLDSGLIKSSLVRGLGMDLPCWTPEAREGRESRAVAMALSLLDAKPLSHARICEAHGLLSDSPSFGAYRTEEEAVVDASGNIVYNAPGPYLVKGQMDDFLDWWNSDREKLPNQLGAAIGHYIFVSIHPFADGNGRLARALVDKAMIMDAESVYRPYSLSSQILKNRGRYYRALASENPMDFPVFMLNAHAAALESGFKMAGRLNFCKLFLGRGDFSESEKAIIKTMALEGRAVWLPDDFRHIDAYMDAWNSLRVKGVVDVNGAFREKWRPEQRKRFRR